LKELEKEYAIEHEHKTTTEKLRVEEVMKIMGECLKKNQTINL
jgi:hypothetical protein